MKKRSYRAQKVNQIPCEEVVQSIQGKALVSAIDVAKVEQHGVLMDDERQVVVTVKWDHPTETPELLQRLCALPYRSLTAVPEPPGGHPPATLAGGAAMAGAGRGGGGGDAMGLPRATIGREDRGGD